MSTLLIVATVKILQISKIQVGGGSDVKKSKNRYMAGIRTHKLSFYNNV